MDSIDTSHQCNKSYNPSLDDPTNPASPDYNPALALSAAAAKPTTPTSESTETTPPDNSVTALETLLEDERKKRHHRRHIRRQLTPVIPPTLYDPQQASVTGTGINNAIDTSGSKAA